VYTLATKSFDDLEIVASAASDLGDNFSLGSSKYDFAALIFIYSERQKYGINSLKIKQNFFQKNL
jgi:hypothetical protein